MLNERLLFYGNKINDVLCIVNTTDNEIFCKRLF